VSAWAREQSESLKHVKPLRVAVTGSVGQVVQSLIRRASLAENVTIIPLARPTLDLGDAASIMSAIATARPDIVVNAAAYTSVDRAEDEPQLAFHINEAGARAVALASARISVPVIQLSTDYVFEGLSMGPLAEDQPTNPQSVYGASKLAGERAVAAENSDHVILRTAWLYSPYGKNFVRTMLRLSSERDIVSVVSDQYGNPTSALDLADGILHIARTFLDSPSSSRVGIFHIAGSGDASWADIAQAVMKECRERGRPYAQVKRIRTGEFPTKARRPLDSRLNCSKLQRCYGWVAPNWQDSLSAMMAELLDADATP
jgi:dTDP-4-dehydrorhamnose reductase